MNRPATVMQGLNILLLHGIRGYKALVWAASQRRFRILAGNGRLAGTKNRPVNAAIDGKLISFSRRSENLRGLG